MDIEYIGDGQVADPANAQARVKAGTSRGSAGIARARASRESAPVVASGRAVGARTVTGIGRFVSSAKDLAAFRPGEILLAELTLPEWHSVMTTAAAIVTNKGGRASHAAITARKLGVPAIVGTIDGASMLWTGATLTISCARGGVGRVYEGALLSETAAGGE